MSESACPSDGRLGIAGGRQERQVSIALGYTLFGVAFGCLFPLIATAVAVWAHQLGLSFSNIALVQKQEPLLWIIDTAPFFLGLFAYVAGYRATEIERINASLERRVEERTADLAAAREMAEGANRAKSDFLSNVSHELRTPLHAIIGFTEFVLENEDEPLTEEQTTSLSQVLKAGRHLLLLINDVLDLSKIEAGGISLSIEPVDATQVVDECVSLMSSFAAGRNVDLRNPLAGAGIPRIEADRIRFKQVFLNLLSNAIKYNRERGLVVIERGDSAADTLRIGVRDTGPGITENCLARLFVPFDRLGAENSAIEGTGIGLTISKRLVDQMGGRLTVDSIVGEGSTFWLEMPVSNRPVREQLNDDQFEYAIPELHGRVLYIEDNPANLELVRRIIGRRPGAEFIGAADGETGVELARAHRPDVILLDIHLPGMDGFKVLRTLRATAETEHIPVIALTAAASDFDKKRGRAAGFYDYLTKPIAAASLLSTIGRALRPNEPGRSAASDRVLVVDDMPVNLRITQRQLQKLDIESDAVADPARALEMLATGKFALALVDMNMPEISGIELTRRLRALERTSGTRTPVIALSASSAGREDVASYRQAGIDGEITKPVILKDLAAKLEPWLSRAGRRSVPQPSSVGKDHSTDDPPVDMDELAEILGTRDPESAKEILKLLLEFIPSELESLSRAAAARNTNRIGEIAHRFRSAAGDAAARRLSELLQTIESRAPNGAWASLDRDLQVVEGECHRVAHYIRHMA